MPGFKTTTKTLYRCCDCYRTLYRVFYLTDMRKTISKRIRFEVFKRDKFTCQYCGESAPKVVLNIDHIHPVSKGGDNNILNLVTACFDCNSGKKDKVLSDDSAISRQKAQLDIIQEKRAQITMMAQWQKELVANEHKTIQIVEDVIRDLMGCYLSPTGKKNMRNRVKSFGVSEVCEAIRIGYNQYYDGSDESIEKVLKYTGGICYNRYCERERLKNNG